MGGSLILVAGVVMAASLSALIGLLLFAANMASTRRRRPVAVKPKLAVKPEEPPEKPEPSPGSGAWRKATATFYDSYPKCCKGSPNYDPGASTSECDDYSGCKYMGQFAAVGSKDYDWVKSNDIAAFFEAGQSNGSWKDKWANKTIQIRNPKSGKTMDVLIADTCGDGDCGGCCTKNANRNGGTLVDLEYHTAKRFWGSDVPGESTLEWRPK